MYFYCACTKQRFQGVRNELLPLKIHVTASGDVTSIH